MDLHRRLGLLAVAASLAAGVAVAAAQPPATLLYPVDIVPAEDGYVVADFKAHGLLQLHVDGSVRPLLQGPGLPRTPLYGARAVIAAPDGDGWIVADPATFGLYRVGAGGELSTITTELDIPQGLVAFDDRSVLVSDLRSGIGAILKVGLDGGVTVFAEVGSPKGIVGDGGDGFAVVSHGERALYGLDRTGRVRTIAEGPPFDFPHDLVRDADGSYVVTDGYASALFRVTADGAVSTLVQGAPLVSPEGIAHDPAGGYVVVDPQAGAVFRVRVDGGVETLYRIPGG